MNTLYNQYNFLCLSKALTSVTMRNRGQGTKFSACSSTAASSINTREQGELWQPLLSCPSLQLLLICRFAPFPVRLFDQGSDIYICMHCALLEVIKHF